MKVYVVTDGVYSDYHIVAAYSTREKAEECVATIKRAAKEREEAEDVGDYSMGAIYCDEPGVKEFELDPGNERVLLYCVVVDGDGNEKQRNERLRYPWQKDEETQSFGRAGAFGVSPRSYEVALKAARDALYEWKARKAGMTP